jgi:hypothetical protein
MHCKHCWHLGSQTVSVSGKWASGEWAVEYSYCCYCGETKRVKFSYPYYEYKKTKHGPLLRG